MNMDQQEQNSQVFHDFKTGKPVSLGIVFLTLFIIILIAFGVGFLFSKSKSSTGNTTTNSATGSTSIVKGTVYGSTDTATFKDMATGTVQMGGINGEGQFHLVRPGGNSQNVYMTSSLVDLSQFVGHKVNVWGQTQTAKTAGWLMDVGKVEVLQ